MKTDQDFGISVLNELYRNMEGSYVDSCFGMNSSDYDFGVKKFLKEAKRLGLTWGDFYKLHEEKLEASKEEYVLKLKKDGLTIKVVERESGRLEHLVCRGEFSEIPSDMKFSDFYESQMSGQIAAVKSGKIVKKFAEDKVIGLDDFGKAKNYFSDNLRY